MIELPPDAPGPWGAVGELVELLPPDWVLIGGLMVQIHAWERGMPDVRATIDVDVLGQAEISRAERGWLRRAEARLRLDDLSNLSAVDMRRARQAFRLLIRDPSG